MQTVQLLVRDWFIALVADHPANLLEALALYFRILGNVEEAKRGGNRDGVVSLCQETFCYVNSGEFFNLINCTPRIIVSNSSRMS